MPAIKHAATKNPGDKGYASEWNADHVIDDNSITLAKLTAGVRSKVSEVDVASNTNAVDFTGLDVNTDRFYELYGTLKNNDASTATYYLFVNADYTITNYYREYVVFTGGSITMGRVNDNALQYLETGKLGTLVAVIMRDPDGYFRFHMHGTRYLGSAFDMLFMGCVKTASITNITELRVASNVASGIGAGSKLTLFRGRSK